MASPAAVSVRRCRPLADEVAEAARRLKHIETTVALLDRVRPLNLTSEQERLQRAFLSGQRASPDFQYAPRALLGEARQELAELAVALDSDLVANAARASRDEGNPCHSIFSLNFL